MSDRKDPAVGDELRAEIAQNIRTRRDGLSMSRKVLGSRLRTANGKPADEAMIYGWEVGRNVPSPPYRPQLAEVLETDEASLFGPLALNRDTSLALQVQQVREELFALAAVLGVSEDQIEVMVARRRRARRATSPVAGDDADLDPLSLVPDRDKGDDEGDAAPRPKGRPRRPRHAAGNGRDKA